MPLKIDTFSNQTGGNVFYKAVTHPLAAEKARALVVSLQQAGPVALYDPTGLLAGFDEFFPLNKVEIAGLYVQNVEHIGRSFHGHSAQPVTQLKDAKCRAVLVAGFDAPKLLAPLKQLLPANAATHSFDAFKLPDDMLTDRRNYLSGLNFAINFALFRDQGGHHTRVVTANYWSTYGAAAPRAFCQIFDRTGKKLAEWVEVLPAANATIVFDSKALRQRFKLPEFTGQLFIHILGAAGHDIVKYALDTYGDTPEVLSCTHDANAWPPEQYAGLPAPAEGEQVRLWIQNSHPCPIPRGGIGLNLMGSDAITWSQEEVPPFGLGSLSVNELMPDAHWPQQLEVQAGKYFVRPRYEITSANGHLRIAHPNVERNDLSSDPQLPKLAKVMGKVFIVPAPILPIDRFTSWALPTPMSTGLQHLPLKALVYDARGTQVLEHKFGNMRRSDSVALNVNDLLAGKKLEGGYGHIELIYDFAAGQDADGWLHGLFRYEDKRSGHAAETSFGAHIFNTVLTYKNEPQSYAGKPPGLSTRLFLRMGQPRYDTVCHLVYPASLPWHSTSDTALILTGADGKEIATRNVRIPCSGSLFWRVSQMFEPADIEQAGAHAYVLIRDTTCRLFGYHGLTSGDAAFSLDHMFGF